MLAAKFFDDHYYNNAYYGKVGGVSNTEVNSLEIEFLFMVNFNLFVATEEYNVYNQRLMTHARAYAGGQPEASSPSTERPSEQRFFGQN